MKSRSRVLPALAAAFVAVAATGTGIAVSASAGDDQSATLAAKIDPSVPKNVILFIGDGMGDAEVTLGRYYGKGAAGRLNMDALPFRGSSLHYVLTPGPGPGYLPNYAGDSAPTATAWSTGKRTQDNRLSQGPSSSTVAPGSNAGYRTFLEIARDAGKATGDVSTAELTDATPAAPTSHISQRACQGPADTRSTCVTETKSAGGLGSIAEQQIDTGVDVYLGGGRARFEQTLASGGSTTVLDYAATKGYADIKNAADLAGVTSLAPGEKVLGLFNDSNMTTEFAPLYARTDAYLSGSGIDRTVNGGSATTRCDETNRPSNEPSLSAMTKKAISLLASNPKGFSLQVEGASIDKRDHAADVCGQIGELLAMDEAVGVAQEFQRTHPDTLIIVTADHAHTSQIISAGSKPATGAAYATVQTVDGAPIRVAYGTADTGTGTTAGGSQAHTGAQVPVWASGPQAANVQGTIDQTDIFSILNGKTPSKIAGTTVIAGASGKDGVAGAAGASGAAGAAGAAGPAGVAGTAGAAGPAGMAGAAGAAGTNGVNGTNGAKGATGAAGRDAKVTCKLSGKKSVKCTVGYGTARKASARLVRNTRTVARGTVSAKGKLTLKAGSRLKRGTYSLVTRGRTVKLKLG